MDDKYAGMGGSYRIDPATGERVLTERTDWTPPAAVDPQPAAAPQPTAGQ